MYHAILTKAQTQKINMGAYRAGKGFNKVMNAWRDLRYSKLSNLLSDMEKTAPRFISRGRVGGLVL